MSKDLIVLTPNGRRQKVHCTPDTNMLQVLEDVCCKQGFQANNYNLKHHNHILDLTTTVRFSNLPNKAMLEMVETEKKREETMVTIGLLLEDGERRTSDFPPNTSLYALVNSLAAAEFEALQQPTILYMRQEIIGAIALKEKTLRHLGLLGGRAILRLLNKADEVRQANVSAVYRVPMSDKPPAISCNNNKQDLDTKVKRCDDNSYEHAGPSNPSEVHHKSVDHVNLIKKEILNKATADIDSSIANESVCDEIDKKDKVIDVDQPKILPTSSSSTMSIDNREKLERRLNIEEEVTFLGTQKAIAFMQQDDATEEIDDLPDDFYELTIEEVRKLYHNLQQNRLELENTPLMTSTKKEEIEKQTLQQKDNLYKNVVVRIQFPDGIILQGVFAPIDKIEDIINFIKTHLQEPEKPFHIFTTPFKETLDPTMSLVDAKFVPCVHMHFKWFDDATSTYLKDEIYEKTTTSDAASILASKYRAPSRRKVDDDVNNVNKSMAGPSTSKNGKLPKWFKK